MYKHLIHKHVYLRLFVLCGNEVFSGTEVLKSSSECGKMLFSSLVSIWRGTRIAGRAENQDSNKVYYLILM